MRQGSYWDHVRDLSGRAGRGEALTDLVASSPYVIDAANNVAVLRQTDNEPNVAKVVARCPGSGDWRCFLQVAAACALEADILDALRDEGHLEGDVPKLFDHPTMTNSKLTEGDLLNYLRSVAPRGATVYAVIRAYDHEYGMAFYTPTPDGLHNIGSMINEELFGRLLATLAYDRDKVRFWGYDGGGQKPGYYWAKNANSNVAIGVIQGLSQVVHGDRAAWKVHYL